MIAKILTKMFDLFSYNDVKNFILMYKLFSFRLYRNNENQVTFAQRTIFINKKSLKIFESSETYGMAFNRYVTNGTLWRRLWHWRFWCLAECCSCSPFFCTVILEPNLEKEKRLKTEGIISVSLGTVTGPQLELLNFLSYQSCEAPTSGPRLGQWRLIEK